MHRHAARNNVGGLEKTWKKETTGRRSQSGPGDEDGNDVVNRLDSAGCTPLFRAASAGHVEAIRWLLDHGADPTLAVRATVAVGSAPGAVPFSEPAPGRTPAHAAAAFSHASNAAETPLTALLSHGDALHVVTAADADGATPLHAAALCGNEVNVELLLSETLLMAVSSTVGTPGEAVHIYDSFVDAQDAQGRTALIYACCWYQGRYGFAAPLPLITRILGAGASVFAKETPAGMTVLHHASRCSPLEVVQAIVAATCSGDAEGAAAVRQARSSNADTEATTMQKGKLVNTKTDADGTTAIVFAITAKRHDNLRFLLEHGGADPNMKAHNGFSALHFATSLYDPRVSKTMRGDVDSVRLLLTSGADADLRDAEGKLPIDYARNNRAIERSIESHSRQLHKQILDRFQESDVVQTEKTLMQLENLQGLSSSLLTEEQAALVKSLAEQGIDPELLKRTQDMLPRLQLMEEQIFSETLELSQLGEEFRHLKEQLGDLSDVPELGQFYAEFEELCQLREEFEGFKDQAAQLQERLLQVGDPGSLTVAGSKTRNRDRDMKLLMQDETRLAYYNVLRGDLCAAHLAASCAKSGMIQGQRKGGLGRAGDMLSALGSAVPIAGPGLQVLGSILRLVDKVNQEKVLGRIAELAVDPVEASELAELVARKLALWEREEDNGEEEEEEEQKAGGGSGKATEDLTELSDKRSSSRAARVTNRLSSFVSNINRTTSAIAGGDMSWFFGALEGSTSGAHQHYHTTEVQEDDEEDAEVLTTRVRQTMSGRGGDGATEAKSGRRGNSSKKRAGQADGQENEGEDLGTEDEESKQGKGGRFRGFFRNTKELLFKDKVPATIPPEATFASEDAKLIIAAVADGLLRQGDASGAEEKETTSSSGSMPIMKSVVERATILIRVLNPDFDDLEAELKVSYRSIMAAKAAADAGGDPNAALFESDDGSGSLGYCMGDMALLPEWKRRVMQLRKQAIDMASSSTKPLSLTEISMMADAIMSRTTGDQVVVTTTAPVLDFHSLSSDGSNIVEATIQDAKAAARSSTGRRLSLRGSGVGMASSADPHSWFACLVSMAKQPNAPPHSGDLWSLVVAHFADGARSQARVYVPVPEGSSYSTTAQALEDCVVQALGGAPANVTSEFAPTTKTPEDDDGETHPSSSGEWGTAQHSSVLTLTALELYQSMLRTRFEGLLSEVNGAAEAALSTNGDPYAGNAADAAITVDESLAGVSWRDVSADREHLVAKRREFAAIAHGFALAQEYSDFVAKVTEEARRGAASKSVELERERQAQNHLSERILQLERELDGSNAQLARVQSATEAVSHEVCRQLEQMRSVHAARESETNARIEGLEASLKTRGEEVQTLGLSVNAAEAAKREADEKVITLESTVSRLQGEASDLRQQTSVAETRIAQQEVQLAAAETAKREADEKVTTLESTVSRLQGEASDLRQQTSVAETRIQQLEVSLEGTQALQGTTEEQRKQLESSLQSSNDRNDTLEAQLAEVRSELNEKTQHMAEVEAENAALKRAHEHDEREQKRFEDELRTREARIAALEEQLETTKIESASRAESVAQLQREAARATEVREAMERKTARLLGALEQAAQATALIQAEELGTRRAFPEDAPNQVSATDNATSSTARKSATATQESTSTRQSTQDAAPKQAAHPTRTAAAPPAHTEAKRDAPPPAMRTEGTTEQLLSPRKADILSRSKHGVPASHDTAEAVISMSNPMLL